MTHRLATALPLLVAACASSGPAPAPGDAGPSPLAGSTLMDASDFSAGRVRWSEAGPALVFAPPDGAPLTFGPLPAAPDGPCVALPAAGWAWVVDGAGPARVLVLDADARLFERRDATCWVVRPLEVPPAMTAERTLHGPFERASLALDDLGLGPLRLDFGADGAVALAVGDAAPLLPTDKGLAHDMPMAAFVPPLGEDHLALGPNVRDVRVEASGDGLHVHAVERAGEPYETGVVNRTRTLDWTLARSPAGALATRRLGLVLASETRTDWGNGDWTETGYTRRIAARASTLVGAGATTSGTSGGYYARRRDLTQRDAWHVEAADGRRGMTLTPDPWTLPELAPTAQGEVLATQPLRVERAGCTLALTPEALVITCPGGVTRLATELAEEPAQATLRVRELGRGLDVDAALEHERIDTTEYEGGETGERTTTSTVHLRVLVAPASGRVQVLEDARDRSESESR